MSKQGLKHMYDPSSLSFLLAPIGGEDFENADVSQERLKGGSITGLRYYLNG
jgi:hypothetical protein